MDTAAYQKAKTQSFFDLGLTFAVNGDQSGGRPKKLFKLYEINELNEKSNKSNSYNLDKVRNKYEIRVEDEEINVSDGYSGIPKGEDTVTF